MTKDQGLATLATLKAFCKKNGLWITVETEEKPTLKMIRIKEISIKIDEE